MGRLFVTHLDEDGKIYSCKYCHVHLAISNHILSRTFHCKHGRAYLFNKLVNVTVGSSEERLMMTGMHTVADIFCVGCGSNVGWKYVAAHEKSQKYKEGKFILERFKVTGPNGSHYSVSHEAHGGGSDGSHYSLSHEAHGGGSDDDA